MRWRDGRPRPSILGFGQMPDSFAFFANQWVFAPLQFVILREVKDLLFARVT
jgi:hypothetical protein